MTMHQFREKSSGQPLLLLVCSMFIFGTIGVFRRFIPLPSDALAFGRGIAGSVFLLIVMKAGGHRFAWNEICRKDAALLFLTGALMGFNWILLFEAYNYTTVAAATLCYYMAPVIVILLSPLLFRERMTGKQKVCAVLSVVGMVLVSGVLDGANGEPGELKGIFLGLGAAVLYASVVLLNKWLVSIPIYEKTIIQLFAAAAALLPYMAVQGTLRSYRLTARELALFLAVCLVHTGIAYAMYFSAIPALPARTCALFSYIDPVTAVILSAVILREPMTVPAAIGAVLIIGSAVYSERG